MVVVSGLRCPQENLAGVNEDLKLAEEAATEILVQEFVLGKHLLLIDYLLFLYFLEVLLANGQIIDI